MKKVILFDAFSFVGYGLCCKMIDESIQVLAVDETPKENSPREDKMLRIGRNSYFEFVEYPKVLVNQKMFEQTDAVIYPWYDPVSSKRNQELFHSVMNSCNDAKSKLILVSANCVNRDVTIDMESELDHNWYSKINFTDSLSEHRKIRTKNIDFLFTFIDFSNHELKEGIQKKNDHEEWISQNFYTK
ncbi:hypothetical protein [Bacillus nitroreducens]